MYKFGKTKTEKAVGFVECNLTLKNRLDKACSW